METHISKNDYDVRDHACMASIFVSKLEFVMMCLAWDDARLNTWFYASFLLLVHSQSRILGVAIRVRVSGSCRVKL